MWWITAIAAIVVFSALIFVHELGHFAAAKWFGVKVNDFSLGMGPAFLKKKVGETVYALRILPIGGHCVMEDEDGSAPGGEPGGRSFNQKPWWARFIILAAGGFMNVLLGYFICVALAAVAGGEPIPQVSGVSPGSHAAGVLRPGDRIVALDGAAVREYGDIGDIMKGKDDTLPVRVTVERDAAQVELSVLPTYAEGQSRFILGILPARSAVGFAEALARGWGYTVQHVYIVYASLGSLFSGQASLSDMSGPAGIVVQIGAAAGAGWEHFLFLAGLIAVNLGLVNLLPLPALDGGRIAFVLWGAATKRPLSQKREAMVHAAGLLLLFALMLFVTYHDFWRYIVGGG